jgi:hypothetical protein
MRACERLLEQIDGRRDASLLQAAYYGAPSKGECWPKVLLTHGPKRRPNRNAVMKPSKTIRHADGADRSVARWSTVLLVALGAVLTALFLSGRLLLSLANDPGTEQTSLREP